MIKCNGDFAKMIKQLKEAKKDFEVRKTTKSTLIKFDNYTYMFAENHFKNEYLNLFQQIKNEVHNNINLKQITPPEIKKSKYFQVANFEKIGSGEFLTFKNCFEFDINKAYYKTLYNLGYISSDFFHLCINLPKSIRLALVGTLATQKTIFYYEAGELKKFETKKDDILRKVFFQVVEYVDRALDYFSKLAKDNFLFYWVDGIYLKDYERAQYHRDLISYEFNLDFSTEPVKEIIIFNKSEVNTQLIVKKTNNKIKTFNLNCIFTPNN